MLRRPSCFLFLNPDSSLTRLRSNIGRRCRTLDTGCWKPPCKNDLVFSSCPQYHRNFSSRSPSKTSEVRYDEDQISSTFVAWFGLGGGGPCFCRCSRAPRHNQLRGRDSLRRRTA